MGGSVGFIVFRGGWCWFLVSINGGFLMVNDSFGGGGDACGGYAFCGFSYEFVVDGVFKHTHVRWCGLFKVRLHGFFGRFDGRFGEV
jgi:hypothetical protein